MELPALMTEVGTSIGFGGGDVIEVSLPLDEVRRLLQACLTDRVLLKLEGRNGETVIINPVQVKVLLASRQPDGEPAHW